jgi:membrane associated rhomboid family serine protease
MAAAVRFVFQRGGPLHLLRENDADAYRIPALPLMTALRDRRILVFLIAWFGINALFAFTAAPIIGTGQVVAWEAHIGGFLAGLIAFAAFDPVPKSEEGRMASSE